MALASGQNSWQRSWAPNQQFSSGGSTGRGSTGGVGGGGGMGFPTRKPAVQPGGFGVSTVNQQPYSPAQSQINMPPAQAYQPQQRSDPNLGYMASQAKGLMDPNSDYYKRLSAGMQGQIGQQAGAQQRASALRGAWGGFGGGASTEQMMTSADIGQSGLEAQGQSEANLRLQAPQLGAQMMQSTFQPQLGYGQLNEGASQFGASMGENQRQYGGNMALQQQQMANQNAQFGAGLGQEASMFNAQAQNQANAQQQQQQWQQMMQQMAMAYS